MNIKARALFFSNQSFKQTKPFREVTLLSSFPFGDNKEQLLHWLPCAHDPQFWLKMQFFRSHKIVFFSKKSIFLTFLEILKKKIGKSIFFRKKQFCGTKKQHFQPKLYVVSTWQPVQKLFFVISSIDSTCFQLHWSILAHCRAFFLVIFLKLNIQ